MNRLLFFILLLLIVNSLYAQENDTSAGAKIIAYRKQDTSQNIKTAKLKISNLRSQSQNYISSNNKSGFRNSYKQAIEIAASSGNKTLLNETKLEYATELTNLNENAEASGLLTGLLKETSLSEEERIHILSLLLINSIKLNTAEGVEKYYDELIRVNIKKYPENNSEYLLAMAMYNELKDNFIQARSYYHALLLNIDSDVLNLEIILDGEIRLAALYSKKFNRDSADYYFNNIRERTRHFKQFNPIVISYLKEYHQHLGRYQETAKLITSMNRELQDKDSVYRRELMSATKDLTYKYRINEGEKNLKIVKQQRDLDTLRYSRSRQRSLIIILGLALLAIGAASLSYLYYYRRKQSVLLHQNETERLKLLHKTEVVKMLAESQEEERRRIADQLHDEVGSMLTVARLNLSSYSSVTTNKGFISPKQLETANKILEDVAGTIRQMSHELMPVAIKQYGLKHAIEQLVSDINVSKKIYVECLIVGMESQDKFPDDLQVSLFRIIQELFQNILKHSKASNAIFQFIEHKDSFNILVEDNGIGMHSDTDSGMGKGMQLLATRVAFYDGTLSVESMPGSGTMILINIPIVNPIKS